MQTNTNMEGDSKGIVEVYLDDDIKYERWG
jgi:hypothetical protein